MRNGQWLDDAPPSAEWTQPVKPFRMPVWVGALIALGLVAALIGAVFAAGGFDSRSDQVAARRPGAVLEIGPYDIILHRVTVQRVQSYDDSWGWEYRIQGAIRNNWHEAVYFKTGEYGWIAVREPRSLEVVTPNNFRMTNEFGSMVPPTGEWQPAEWWEEMESEPSAYLLVGFLGLEYNDNSLLPLGTRTWNPSDDAYQTYVPVIRLPDRPSS